MVVDWSLIITLGVIFFITLLGAWLRSRRKDECLTAFEGYHVTLERVDGRIVCGTVHVEPTGTEFLYRHAVQDQHHVEASYILYQSEYENIQAIYRFADDLDEANRVRRTKQIKQWFNPGPLRLFMRKTRNFLSTASDSFNEVIGIMVGRARKPAGQLMTDTSESYLKQFGGDLIGHAGHRHDPLLERFIGQRVVFELSEDGEVHEHVGIFKNYSADFLELLDVQFPVREILKLTSSEPAESWGVTAKMVDGDLHISNACNYPVLLQKMVPDQAEEELLDVVVDAAEEVVLYQDQYIQSAQLSIKIVRELDIIVPRARCVIRHRAAHVETNYLPDIIFDLGLVLRSRSRDTVREARLRESLQQDQLNAIAAANLGALLVRQGKYDEAESYLNSALEMRNSLPDRGRRAQMGLREIGRRRNRGKTYGFWASSVHRDISTFTEDPEVSSQ